MPPTPPSAHVFQSKNQIVSLVVTLRERFVTALKLPAMRKPESKPLRVGSKSCRGIQGAGNVDCVTVWFPCVTVEKSRGVSKNVIYVKYNAWHGNPC